MDKKGFTLIELIMTMMLAALLAAIAVPYLFRGEAPLTVPAFARKVADDIRYAQSLAMLRSNLDTPQATNPHFLYRIRFNVADASCPGVNQYTIVNDADNNGTWGENPNGTGQVESARVPSTGGDYFCVSMDSGDFAGFTVSADFGGSVAGVLAFDPFGVPFDSDGNAIAAPKTLTVSRAGESTSVTVTPNTGFVTVQ